MWGKGLKNITSACYLVMSIFSLFGEHVSCYENVFNTLISPLEPNC